MARNDVTILLSGKDEASKMFQKLSKEINVTTRQLKNLSTSAGDVGRSLTAALTVPIAAVGGAALKMGIDAIESEDLFERSMGGMADSARKFSVELRDSLGINDFAARQTIATFDVMLESVGLNEKAALSMSKTLTKLGYDMASLRNKPIQEMFEKLQSGITGEIEPLRRLGISLHEKTIQTYAYSHGIANAGEELTELQKVLARFGVILERTKIDQNNMADTLQSPANQLRILREQITLTSTEFGLSLIPIVKTATKEIAPLVEKLRDLSIKFEALPESSKGFIAATVGITAAAGPIALAVSGLSKLASIATGSGAKLLALAAIGSRLAFAFRAVAGGAATFGEALIFAAGGPAGAISLALVGLAVGTTRIITKWDEMRVGGLNAWGQIKLAAIDATDWIVKKLLQIAGSIPLVNKGLKEWHKNLQEMAKGEKETIIKRDIKFLEKRDGSAQVISAKERADIIAKNKKARAEAEAEAKAIRDQINAAQSLPKEKKADKKTVKDVIADLDKELNSAASLEKMLGNQFDLNSAKASAFNSALKELTEMGLKPGNKVLDDLTARYKKVNVEQQAAEAAALRLSRTKDLLQQASQMQQEWTDREVSSYEKLARQLEAQAKLDKSRAGNLLTQAAAVRELEKAEAAEAEVKKRNAQYVDVVTQALQQIGTAFEGDITENERIARQLETMAQSDKERRSSLLQLADALRQVDAMQAKATDSAEALSEANEVAQESQNLLSQAAQEFTNWNERNLSSLEKLARQLESQAMLDSERADSLLSQASALRELEQAQNSYNSALEMETKTRDLLDKAKETLSSGDEKGLSEFERLARELDAQAGAETDHNRSWDLQAQARALREKDWMDSMGKMEFVVDSTTKAFNQFKESLTNVPQGFKMALARWNSATPSAGYPYAVGGAGSSGGVTNNFNIGNAYGVDDIKKVVLKAVAEGERKQRLASGGSLISK